MKQIFVCTSGACTFREDFVVVAIGGGQTGPCVLRIQSGNITWTVSGNFACIWLVDVYEITSTFHFLSLLICHRPALSFVHVGNQLPVLAHSPSGVTTVTVHEMYCTVVMSSYKQGYFLCLFLSFSSSS